MLNLPRFIPTSSRASDPFRIVAIKANPKPRFEFQARVVPVDGRTGADEPRSDELRSGALHAPCRATHDRGMTTTILVKGA